MERRQVEGRREGRKGTYKEGKGRRKKISECKVEKERKEEYKVSVSGKNATL